ncbi:MULTISPECIES: arsenic resistance protein [Lentzea]|uniref:Arsenite efflux pump ArsB, ACR3 family n=2 Tax=Lentzea TaxID=165301 RepID=A0A1W2AM35_9PSEU|nr:MULTISPECIES: bile acid:sodium symporter [Lentzea]MDX8140483.1 bile acid:sodium symporter [Lentzea sp. BCCO 10_0061]SMC61521.1 Arsenite efflux pump ArsB, ACR3 family [Lentzea albidocapillata]
MQGTRDLVSQMERHQVPIYVGAIAAGILVGLLAPGAGPGLETAINPVLGVLLYVTFLQVPARELLRSLRAGRFLAAALVVNFVVVPLVVAAMFGFLPSDDAVRIGVLLVLLTPCVDYVIVFSGLAGGSSERLLAATPLLLIAQMLLLPLFLLLFLGSDLANIVELGPFLEAFLVLIVIPLALAWATQAWAARHPSGVTFSNKASTTMVPLMVATLLVVVASQIPKLGDDVSAVFGVIPFYVVFLVVMAVLGLAVARVFRLRTQDGRAIVFTGATRNSLVVLPLALALPDAFGVAGIVIVTQTLVEVVGMVIYVRVIPKLIPGHSKPSP